MGGGEATIGRSRGHSGVLWGIKGFPVQKQYENIKDIYQQGLGELSKYKTKHENPLFNLFCGLFCILVLNEHFWSSQKNHVL